MAQQVFGGLPDAFIQEKVTVGTSAVQCPSTSPADSLTFLADPSNSAQIRIGKTDGVTTSTGYPLAAGSSITLKINNSNLVYAISASTSQVLHIAGS